VPKIEIQNEGAPGTDGCAMIQYVYLDLVSFSNASNILLTDVTTYVFDIGQPSFNGKTNPTSLSVISAKKINNIKKQAVNNFALN